MSGARRCFALAVCAAALTACATTPSAPKSPKAGGPCDWSYSNQAAWPTICPQYAACGNGSRQSPINVTGALARSLPALEFAYGPRQVTVVDTGHDIQVQLPAGGSTSLTVGGRTYQLAQFHFHEPSEHTVNGQGAAMEVHFVHADQGGELTVVGVLMRPGAHNPTIQSILDALRTQQPTFLDPASLLPADRSYEGYAGSLTTPPCTEGVRWHVLHGSIELSGLQIANFKTYYSGNARRIQDPNGRVILTKE